MRNILIVCGSQQTAEEGMRIAADLSVVCGASLSLAYAPEQPVSITASSGLDAMGHLADVLFTRGDWRRPVPLFALADAGGWLATMQERVSECWEVADPADLPAHVRERRPDLIVTCDAALARMLVAQTSAPVWHVRPEQRERAWFLSRKLRCAVRGSRAMAWAGAFAAGLGVEIETMPARRFAADRADLLVVAREEWASLLRPRAIPPVIVV